MKTLIEEVEGFLSLHAGIRADYDPDYDTLEERFSSPDASEMLAAAQDLEKGKKPSPPRSSWSSGGYKPYTDKKAKAWHDSLVQRLTNLPTP